MQRHWTSDRFEGQVLKEHSAPLLNSAILQSLEVQNQDFLFYPSTLKQLQQQQPQQDHDRRVREICSNASMRFQTEALSFRGDHFCKMERGPVSLTECRGIPEVTAAQHITDTALTQGERCCREKNKTLPAELKQEASAMVRDSNESSWMKLQALDVDLCPSFLSSPEERAAAAEEQAPQPAGNGPAEEGGSGEPIPAFKSWQTELENGREAHRSPGADRLLQHVAEGDNPLISPRCSSFSKSQRFVLDTETAPSPPSAQLFIMPRNSSLVNSEAENAPVLVMQLTKQIQNLRKKIRKYEEKFEQEKKYRPSHSDKVGDPEVLKWMNDLTRARKQLKELKLKISEEENNRRHRLRSSLLSVNSRQDKENKQHVTELQQKPSVEETVQIVMKKLKEKQEMLGLPEDVKEMTRKQLRLDKVNMQNCLLHFERIHGQQVSKQERLLMKPLYDRYQSIRQLLSPAAPIPTIEEEGSDEESILKGCEISCRQAADFPFQEFVDNVGHQDEEGEPGFNPLDEKKDTRQLTTSLSNLHEASMPELLEHHRETRAEKKKLRKTLREFEDQFYKQTGRNVQKEDRIPMAEEYSEYKHIKAKLRLLEVFITKLDGSKTLLSS